MFLCGECVGWMGCESKTKDRGPLIRCVCVDDKFDRNIAPTRERWKQAGSECHQCHNHRQHRQYRWRLLIIMENKCDMLVCMCMKWLLGGDFGWSYFVIYRSATPNENAWPILFFSATGSHTNTRRAPPLSAMTVARSLCKTAQQCIHLQGLWWRLTDAAPAPLHHAAAMSGRAALADGCGVCRQASPILTPSVNRSIDRSSNQFIHRSIKTRTQALSPSSHLAAPRRPRRPAS